MPFYWAAFVAAAMTSFRKRKMMKSLTLMRSVSCMGAGSHVFHSLLQVTLWHGAMEPGIEYETSNRIPGAMKHLMKPNNLLLSNIRAPGSSIQESRLMEVNHSSALDAVIHIYRYGIYSADLLPGPWYRENGDMKMVHQCWYFQRFRCHTSTDVLGKYWETLICEQRPLFRPEQKYVLSMKGDVKSSFGTWDLGGDSWVRSFSASMLFIIFQQAGVLMDVKWVCSPWQN